MMPKKDKGLTKNNKEPPNLPNQLLLNKRNYNCRMLERSKKRKN